MSVDIDWLVEKVDQARAIGVKVPFVGRKTDMVKALVESLLDYCRKSQMELDGVVSQGRCQLCNKPKEWLFEKDGKLICRVCRDKG